MFCCIVYCSWCAYSFGNVWLHYVILQHYSGNVQISPLHIWDMDHICLAVLVLLVSYGLGSCYLLLIFIDDSHCTNYI